MANGIDPQELSKQLLLIQETLSQHGAAIQALKKTLIEANLTTPAAIDALFEKALADWKASPAGQRHETIKKFLGFEQ